MTGSIPLSNPVLCGLSSRSVVFATCKDEGVGWQQTVLQVRNWARLGTHLLWAARLTIKGPDTRLRQRGPFHGLERKYAPCMIIAAISAKLIAPGILTVRQSAGQRPGGCVHYGPGAPVLARLGCCSAGLSAEWMLISILHVFRLYAAHLHVTDTS